MSLEIFMTITEKEIFELINEIQNNIQCYCGGGAPAPHELGVEKCYREIAKDKYLPIPSASGNYIVNGHEVTEYTLVHQRLYSKHECGIWSLPKDHSSINSLPDET